MIGKNCTLYLCACRVCVCANGGRRRLYGDPVNAIHCNPVDAVLVDAVWVDAVLMDAVPAQSNGDPSLS